MLTKCFILLLSASWFCLPSCIVVATLPDYKQVAGKEHLTLLKPIISPNIFHMWIYFAEIHICSANVIKPDHTYIFKYIQCARLKVEFKKFVMKIGHLVL